MNHRKMLRSNQHEIKKKSQYLTILETGEFPQFSIFAPFYFENQIWIAGALKLAVFSKDGEFIEQKKTKYHPEVFADKNR